MTAREEIAALDDPLAAAPPDLTLAEAAEAARSIFGIEGEASRLHSERDANFRIDTADGSFVLKVYNPAEPAEVIDMQTGAMLHVAAVDPSLPVPRVIPTSDGEARGVFDDGGIRHAVQLVTFLEGRVAAPDDFDLGALGDFGALVARMGRALRSYFHPAAGRVLLWDAKHASLLRPLLDELDDPGRRAVAASALDRFEAAVAPSLGALRAQVIHNDLTYDNVLVGADRRPVAVVDFGDVVHSPLLFDVAVALAPFCAEPGLFERIGAFVRGYGRVTPLEQLEVDLLPHAISARLAASVLISAWRVRRFPENADYITAFDAITWPVLERFHELGSEELERRVRTAVAGASATDASVDELAARRRKAFGAAALPLTYERPLHMVRAEGVWMFDAGGRRYLDAYNNVPAVGHSHPRVVEAIAAQARLLNTNSRYLHEAALELAERLTATMPDGLDSCLFVNSGSEANDLAWRFATAVTGGSGGIVSAWGYHGVTAAQADFSPSDWAPHESRRAHVETVRAPDGYRGEHRRGEGDWWRPYVDDVTDAAAALSERGRPPAAMYLDSCWTSDGIFTEAEGYGAAAADAVREAGGLFVADEVQAGYGRLGAALWSFQLAGVEPDFVTLGKPMGNGHPAAAVVTRSEIAEEFVRHREPVFSTFGGNPVACAAALAVLDVIEEERILEHVRESGAYLLDRLRGLAARHEAIGDVRGRGLAAGVELVTDREARTPDRALAARVLNGMRERGVLVGVTGRDANVLKIRPPLVFGREHADVLVETLDAVLAG